MGAGQSTITQCRHPGARQNTATQCRHPGESRGPALDINKLDSGFRRNDGRLGRVPSAQDRAPPPNAVMSALDTNKLASGRRRNDGRLGRVPSAQNKTPPPNTVTPAKAGVQLWLQTSWLPAVTGMTRGCGWHSPSRPDHVEGSPLVSMAAIWSVLPV